ncbi:MAG: hypothetical protein ACR2KI_07505 [Candidatus Limnocylindria bacterium]|nr:MAG: hypothetical protein DLM71_00895 [Chloroflexota bacterium]
MTSRPRFGEGRPDQGRPGSGRLPRLGEVTRAAAVDFYFNSWRLVPANALWGAGALGLLAVASVWPLGALLLAPLLAFPTVGIFAIAATIARGEPASFSDAVAVWRERAGATLLAGIAFVLVVLVLGSNLVRGALSGAPPGWALATLAAWGLVATWLLALAGWPLLVDPRSQGRGLIAAVSLAGRLLLVFPGPLAALGAFALAVVVLSTVLLPALLTISVSYLALVACRYLLPAADRIGE